MPGMNTRWCNTELDDPKARKRFRRRLMALSAESRTMTTPYWKSDFINWLIYEGTLAPCGARVESITPDAVTFEVNCSGVQSEGICLDATFEIPTSEFTRFDLSCMIHDFEFHPCYRIGDGIHYGPFDEHGYITGLEWWYDGVYDESEEG